MIRIASINNEDLAPARPCRLPATDKSWHGLPKVMISTGGILPPWICVMSPRCSMFGKCFLVMAMAWGTISLAHMDSIPSIWAAKGKPPMPSNRLPSVNVFDMISPRFRCLLQL